MAKFLKFSLLWVLVTVIVWLAFLGRWHSRGFSLSGTELTLYLLVVPLEPTPTHRRPQDPRDVPAMVLGHANEWQRMAWVLYTRPARNSEVS